jgi:hypothetical protein
MKAVARLMKKKGLKSRQPVEMTLLMNDEAEAERMRKCWWMNLTGGSSFELCKLAWKSWVVCNGQAEAEATCVSNQPTRERLWRRQGGERQRRTAPSLSIGAKQDLACMLA